MAITFYQKPLDDSATVPVITNYTPVVPYVVSRNSSISSLFYYKLILEVYSGSSVVADNIIARLKQTRNPYSIDLTLGMARAVFDIRNIVKSQIYTAILDGNDGAIPYNFMWRICEADPSKIFSTTTGQVQTITVRAIESFSTASDTIATDDVSGAITNTKIYINASEDLTFPRNTVAFNYQPDGANAVLYNYQLDGDTKQFLSEMPLDTVHADFMKYNYNGEGGLKYINYVDKADWMSLAFMNGVDQFGSNGRGYVVEYYNGETKGLSWFFQNKPSMGGVDPVAGSTLDDEGLILYAGCGPENLETQTITTLARPSNQFSGAWTHYRVFMVSNTSAIPPIPGLTYSAVSASYWFVRGCATYFGSTGNKQYRYKPIRLSWVNRFGCLDTYTFLGKSTETAEITRTEYEKLIGNFNTDIYSYGDYERQKSTSSVSYKVKLTIGTEYISERLVPFIESLIKSKEVYMHHSPEETGSDAANFNTPAQAVIVTQSNFVRKTSVNDKTIQYSINLEYANNPNTNAQ